MLLCILYQKQVPDLLKGVISSVKKEYRKRQEQSTPISNDEALLPSNGIQEDGKQSLKKTFTQAMKVKSGRENKVSLSQVSGGLCRMYSLHFDFLGEFN